MIVYISHPIRGDVAANVEQVWRIMWEVRLEGVIPIAPYIGLFNLDPENPRQRWIGMLFREMLFRFRVFDEVWVYGEHVSKGMIEDISLADACDIPFRIKTAGALAAFAQYEKMRATQGS